MTQRRVRGEHEREGDTSSPTETAGTAGPAPMVLGNAAASRLLQRFDTGSQGAGPLNPDIGAAIDNARGGGSPLPESVGTQMGNQFGVDLSPVRVHTDSQADTLSRSVQATAFTTGTDIFFSSGAYEPSSSTGQELLAHELTHVVQQSQGPGSGSGQVSHPQDRAEVEARQVARAMTGPGLAAAGNQTVSRAMGVLRSVDNSAPNGSAALVQREEAGQHEEGQREAGGQHEEGGRREEGGSGGLSAPTPKFTFTVPPMNVGEVELEYAKVALSVGGSVDYEITPAGSEGGAEAKGEAEKKSGPEIKSAYGVNTSAEGPRYQAEVGAEFEKRTTGLLAGSTPKAKIGGEVGTTGGQLGVEGSLEGEHFETKLGFVVAEMDEKEGIHFGALEAGLDWKMAEFKFKALDGSIVKCTPKITPKLVFEPEYKEIFRTLAERAAAVISADALICGSMLLAAGVQIGGFLLTLDDGTDYARAIDNADKARQQLVDGFVASAAGQPLPPTDNFTMEGGNQGAQWRRDLQDGQRPGGIPVPPSIIDVEATKNLDRIRKSAYTKANAMMHEALVERYWEIHYIQRYNPIAEIEDIFMALMDEKGFGKPGPKEGKSSSGTSVLAP